MRHLKMEAPTIINHFLFTCVRNTRALNVQWINGLQCNYLKGIQYCVLYIYTSFQRDSLGHSKALERVFSAVNCPLETAFKCKISHIFSEDLVSSERLQSDFFNCSKLLLINPVCLEELSMARREVPLIGQGKEPQRLLLKCATRN